MHKASKFLEKCDNEIYNEIIIWNTDAGEDHEGAPVVCGGYQSG